MSGHINSSGSWKELKSAHCKVGGEWKEIKSGYANDSGTWKEIYSTSKIYSIIYDKSLASDPSGCLTYAGACESFTPMIGGSGKANEGSWANGNGTLFDSIKVGYLNGSTFMELNKDAMTGVRSYNAFTRIPKIYQKVTQLDSNRVQLDISLKPFSGGTLHPAFIMDGVELTYKDIGRYLGYINSSKKLCSKSGYSPDASIDRPTFRIYAQANGSNYGLLSYYDWDLVNKLYLLAFKNWNSQVALGLGYTSTSNSAKDDTGKTNNKSWMYGTSSDTSHIMLLGLEDWWGNLRSQIDNIIVNNSGIYASNVASPSDNIDDMKLISLNSLSKISNRYPLTCKAGLDDFFIGTDNSATSNSSGMCDQQYSVTDTSNSSKIAIGGGSYNEGSKAGAFFLYLYYTISTTGSNVGARLVHWE